MRIIKLILLLAPFIFSACGKVEHGSKADISSRKLNVVATTAMIADAVKNVGGERVKVSALMGPGVDPHLYKASEGDVTLMAQADIIFFNGLHLEAKMGDIIEKIQGGITTSAVSDGIEKSELIELEGFSGSYDPHIWFDVKLWAKAVEKIRDVLIFVDPDNSLIYTTNAKNYIRDLDDLHNYVLTKTQLIPEEKRVLVTAHDAFGYFGKRYGFTVKGLQGISTVTEAGAADVRGLADFIAQSKIAAIFVETSVAHRNIEALQAAVRSRGFDVKIGGQLYSDSMGAQGTSDGTYTGMVRHNIDTISEALAQN